MGRLLDRLAQRLWVPWFACVGAAAVLVALDATNHDVAVGILAFALVACMLVVVCNSLVWQSRALDAFAARELKDLRTQPRDWTFAALLALSALAIGAVYIFDLTHDLIMPLVASVMIPVSLKNRSEFVSLLASRQQAR